MPHGSTTCNTRYICVKNGGFKNKTFFCFCLVNLIKLKYSIIYLRETFKGKETENNKLQDKQRLDLCDCSGGFLLRKDRKNRRNVDRLI